LKGNTNKDKFTSREKAQMIEPIELKLS